MMNSSLKKTVKNVNILEPLQDRHQEVIRKAELLHEIANNLVYEGKASLGKNLTKIEGIINFLKDKLFPHMVFDENCIYPYLGEHIPKYEPTIQFLTGEHKELRDNFAIFEHLFADLKAQNNDEQRQDVIDKLRDRGIYLFCIIRNHLQAEEQTIHKAILEQLHNGEKKELFEKILQCDCAKNYIHRHSEESL